MKKVNKSIFDKCTQIVIQNEETKEILAVIEPDGRVLNPSGILVRFNYGEPKRFFVKEGD